MAEAEKNAATKVNGCVSQVWLVSERDHDLLSYRGESDAMIVRGLAAILIALYSGRLAREIADTDAIAIFDELGLREHLSTQRSNGLVAMVNRIRSRPAPSPPDHSNRSGRAPSSIHRRGRPLATPTASGPSP